MLREFEYSRFFELMRHINDKLGAEQSKAIGQSSACILIARALTLGERLRQKPLLADFGHSVCWWRDQRFRVRL